MNNASDEKNLKKILDNMIRGQKALETKAENIREAVEGNNWEEVRNLLVKYEDSLDFTYKLASDFLDKTEDLKEKNEL